MSTAPIRMQRERHAETQAAATQLAAHVTGQCPCDCHLTNDHCDTCCQHLLCVDCLYYAMEG